VVGDRTSKEASNSLIFLPCTVHPPPNPIAQLSSYGSTVHQLHVSTQVRVLCTLRLNDEADEEEGIGFVIVVVLVIWYQRI